ncbi:MAG TPA: TrbI/VirB10 family protein [Allosphingosinicella sp.]|jgi:type IV secretion system protein VirB10
MASRTPPLDPRIANPPPPAQEPAEAGVRPVVALPRSGLPPAAIVAAIIVAAIILFIILDSRRRAQAEPAVEVSGAGTVTPPPPTLFIPPAPPPPVLVAAPVPVAAERPPAPAARPYTPPPQPEIRYVPQAAQQPSYPAYTPPPPPPPPLRTSNSPTIVIDTSPAPPAAQAGDGPGSGGGDRSTIGGNLGSTQPVGRVRSGVFANRSTTVVQGALIPAVLETAFNSRRPGFARAIVSRDVRGFDGTRVLIPRGSRLSGEYRSDIAPGQKRALINWTRLIRPDGVTIALASPAADTLGRGGVSGDYNSHFFERFTGALLQSALDVGVNVASRAAAGNVIVALPGSTQNASRGLLESARILPTLTVPAGTSISVFVARDLDFSSAERPR